MASLVLDDCQIFANEIDLTGSTNQAMITPEADNLDVSTFGSAGWREFIRGVPKVDWEIGGPWGFTDPDDATWDRLTAAQTDPVITIATTSTAGDVAYAVNAHAMQRVAGGTYGGVPTWNLTGTTAKDGTLNIGKGLFRGGLSLTKQTITGDTNGAAIELAGLSGDDNDGFLFVVHVFTDNGTSLDVVLERDDNSGFTTPGTQTTVAVSGVGHTMYVNTGAFMGDDTFFRARTANLVGTSFTIAAFIGTRIA